LELPHFGGLLFVCKMHPDWYWVLPFTIIDSLNRVFYGMYGTLIGPSQPYFAQAVNVDIDTVNWMSPIG
jgi:hypothetical protein